MSSNIRLTRICQQCGQEFVAKTLTTQSCGDACAKKLYKAKIKQARLDVARMSEQARGIAELRNTPSPQPTPLQSNAAQRSAPAGISADEIAAVAALWEKPILSVKETCLALGMGRATFYRNVAAGRISLRKLGGKTYVKTDDILTLF